MGLKMTAEKQAKTASNKIGAFDVQYNFEHIYGEQPEVIKARGTVEGSQTLVDAMFYPANGNFHIMFNGLTDDTDVNIIVGVLKDMRELK